MRNATIPVVNYNLAMCNTKIFTSDTGTRTPVCRVRGGYDNHLHHIGSVHTMHQPRIELGAQRWQRWILPLNHWCLIPLITFIIKELARYEEFFPDAKKSKFFAPKQELTTWGLNPRPQD